MMKIGNARFFYEIFRLGGPIGTISRWLSYFGLYGLLNSLLLVGDVSPHLYFFTEKGLTSILERHGFHKISKLKLEEVGAELPQRIRAGEPISGWKKYLLILAGKGFELLSPFWPDTEVYLFSYESPGQGDEL